MNNYQLVLNNGTFLFIQDTSIGKSITNSAEEVIRELYELNVLKNGMICYYKDTMGQVDILLHENGEFIDFQFGFSSYDEFEKEILSSHYNYE